MTLNPLLAATDLPLFDQIAPEHVAPAVESLLQQASAALDHVTEPDFPADWNEIAKVLGTSIDRLGRAWGTVGHLNAVADTADLRSAYNASLPAITAFWTRLGADERLYAKYKAIDPSALNTEQRQALQNSIRDFVLSGAEFTGLDRTRFAAIQERQAELSQKFSENTLDATDRYTYFATLEELAGVPADVVQAAQAAASAYAAKNPGSVTAAIGGADAARRYLLTLKMPCYLPVMQTATSSALRQTLYRAYTTRASDMASTEAERALDNTTLINEILALRLEEAQLLGYPNFAEVSLAPKMAGSAGEVVTFLRDLAARARPFAEQDLTEMRQFAADHLDLREPQAWDWPYIAEKLKEARYAFSEQEVKLYFTAPKVLAGLFKIIETLFEVEIRPDTAPTWHASVQFYRLERKGELIGRFYLDQPARNGKRGGAWMNEVKQRWLRPDTGALQTPVAHLVCNFAEGANVDGIAKPALLTHDDVITLFHEFGHGLHHMLTQVSEREVSGINGVEWDAVELPSQFMENFCWEWDVIKHMTAHVDTGAPLPRALWEKMLAAKNFQSGLQTLRQIEFSLLDMLLHMQTDAATPFKLIHQQVRDEVALIQPPEWNRTAHTFSHIFAGGYAAGYYSYKWAEVLSADAYAAFEETAGADGAANVETGRKYRHAILEAGGSRPALESFKAFRGREPTMDALLRHQGMTPAAS
ncbi:MAG: M3 family metallopeptidase [Burkholderiaceae bacterium]